MAVFVLYPVINEEIIQSVYGVAIVIKSHIDHSSN